MLYAILEQYPTSETNLKCNVRIIFNFVFQLEERMNSQATTKENESEEDLKEKDLVRLLYLTTFYSSYSSLKGKSQASFMF